MRKIFKPKRVKLKYTEGEGEAGGKKQSQYITISQKCRTCCWPGTRGNIREKIHLEKVNVKAINPLVTSSVDKG